MTTKHGPRVPGDRSHEEAVREGRSRGGRKGGPARAASLSPERRAEIARAAAKARWHREDAADGEARG